MRAKFQFRQLLPRYSLAWWCDAPMRTFGAQTAAISVRTGLHAGTTQYACRNVDVSRQIVPVTIRISRYTTQYYADSPLSVH